MKPDNMVIVIGREAGSGGRKIGRMIAERLGMDYYDSELLNKAAADMGFSTEVFNRADEKKPSVFNRAFMSAFGVQQTFVPNALTGEDLYAAQSRVIRALGEKGNCVIIGRTADHILRHHPGLVSIFLHAPVEHRAKQMTERGDGPDIATCMEIAAKHDKQRESYYNYYTGRKWGAAANYHLSIDSSRQNVEDLVECIIKYVNTID